MVLTNRFRIQRAIGKEIHNFKDASEGKEVIELEKKT